MINTANKHRIVSSIKTAYWVVILFATHYSMALSADWPMWRYDANRSAACPEELPAELNLEWVHQYSPRTLTWDDPLNQDIMHYDKVFEPIVAGNNLILGFNDSDKVIALDINSGKEKWSFYVDGPVRFPPAAWNGKVCFSSDDGYLYCLQASDGKQVWKFRGGPNERKILGNKRLISTWPARGAPVIKDGIVYFGASIWPFMGTFIYALDADTGKVVWKNDSTGAQYIRQPHNAPSFAGVAPQGAFVAAGDRLLIPGGRSVPACFDRNTGEFQYYELAGSGKTGGAFVCATENVFFNHHREQIITMYDLETGLAISPHLGRYPVLDGGTFYFSGNTVSAYDSRWIGSNLDTWKKQELKTTEIPTLATSKWKEHFLWGIPVDSSGDLIKAGNRLYASGENHITAINLSSDGKTAEVAWAKTVNGTVERLIAAQGKLFAVTLDGRIMAFGSSKKDPKYILNRPTASGASQAATKKALSILEDTGVKDGYALFYGLGDGDLPEALINNSKLHIIAVDPDEKKVKAMHRRFDDAGLYGNRIAVLTGDPYMLTLPPYLASLTVIHDLNTGRYPVDANLLDRFYYSMRPYGGKLWIGSIKSDELSRTINKEQFPGLVVSDNSGNPVMTREGALDGSASWTHNYGNIANTAKSDDRLVKLPLGILWFGGNPNTDVLPRHGHGPGEQIIGGRLFIEGINSMSARDVYTGRVIWKVPLHDLGTYNVYYDETYKDTPTDTRYNQVHIPGANIRGTNFIATPDRVYVIQGSSSHVLDTATGETLKVITLPPEDPKAEKPVIPPWGYIGVYGDLLIGGSDFVAFSDLVPTKKKEYSIWEDFDTSASKKLVVMDRYTGEVKWQFESRYGFLHNGIAVGKDILFCLDKLPPHVEGQFLRRGKTVPEDYRLCALDIRTGNLLWEDTAHVFGSFLSFSEEHDILLQSTRPSRDMVSSETGERMNTFRGGSGNLIWDKALKYPTFPILHGKKIITEGNMFDLLTGEPEYRVNPFTYVNVEWGWTRMYGCNYPIASENLITFRSGAAGFYDLTNDSGTGNIGGFKSGCTAVLVAADGVLNAPDYTRTCNCAYQNQTSLALVHMPENELWTYNTFKFGEEPIRNIGLNFGAPGDRRADNGTLWLDYPNVGGPSPEITVTTTPGNPEWFLHHSSLFEDVDLPWIVSSGGKGLHRIAISLAKGSTETRNYTIRLYFAEPDGLGKGQRVFDVALQDKPVLKGFDISAESGKAGKSVVKEFKGIQVQNDLIVSLNPVSQTGRYEPVINGIEVIEE